MNLDEFLESVMPTVGEHCHHGGTPGAVCQQWADHTCTDELARCARHCVCGGAGAGSSAVVSLTITLADVRHPVEAARRLLSIVRAAPEQDTELIVRVEPVDAPPSTVTISAATQREDQRHDGDWQRQGEPEPGEPEQDTEQGGEQP